ncbi:MAG: hypothetical protein K1X36_03305 [Pyrinomonadaceae bacterium]|nr:hypothetical protein [Pyrinomonadaceae bacterium]
MDAVKLHLLLNYIPLMGVPAGAFLLFYGYIRSRPLAKKTGLILLVLTAIVTLGVFGSGEAAGKGSDLMIGPVWANIRQHKAFAFQSFATIESMGVFALFGLINLMRGKQLAKWLTIVLLTLSLAAIGLTIRTAYFGRQIYSVEAPAVK